MGNPHCRSGEERGWIRVHNRKAWCFMVDQNQGMKADPRTRKCGFMHFGEYIESHRNISELKFKVISLDLGSPESLSV